jgi:type I restriction enzyme S subunit
LELTKTNADLILSKGYKHTEVGVIPEEWDIMDFGDIFSFYSTSNFSKAQMSEESEVGCMHYGLIHAISNSNYDLKSGVKYFVSEDQAKYEFIKDGDVVMVDASEDLEGLNKSVEVFGVGNKKYIAGLHTYLLRDKYSLLTNSFRGFILNSRIVKQQMLKLAVGMKVYGVSKTQLTSIKIPVPTLAEQKAIATALSDVDSLISSLDKLIIKKKAIKQGAIHELLTPPHKGGKRLPGFSGDWEEKYFGDLGQFHKGKGIKKDEVVHDGIPCVRYGEIYTLYSNKIEKTISFIDKSTSKYSIQLHYGDLLFAGSGETKEEIGKSAVILRNDTYAGGDIVIFRTKEIDFQFLGYLSNFTPIQKQKSLYGQGDAVVHIYSGGLSKVKIPLPPTLTEQKAIAQILSDMDLEIESLEAKKEKYQGIKQGMMQELLTGKTRLI